MQDTPRVDAGMYGAYRLAKLLGHPGVERGRPAAPRHAGGWEDLCSSQSSAIWYWVAEELALSSEMALITIFSEAS
jgi:hypothetical protein